MVLTKHKGKEVFRELDRVRAERKKATPRQTCSLFSTDRTSIKKDRSDGFITRMMVLGIFD